MPSALLDDRLNLSPIDQQITWTAANQKVSDEEFHVMATRLVELEAEGVVTIADAMKESYSGHRRWSVVFFRRLR